jgi:hypothetical protein
MPTPRTPPAPEAQATSTTTTDTTAQVPVLVPINVDGSTVNVIGLLNPSSATPK